MISVVVNDALETAVLLHEDEGVDVREPEIRSGAVH
jgi:hypothetical protein